MCDYKVYDKYCESCLNARRSRVVIDKCPRAIENRTDGRNCPDGSLHPLAFFDDPSDCDACIMKKADKQ